MGSFIALYGLDNSRTLIAEAFKDVNAQIVLWSAAMPLRCTDVNENNSIQAFDLTDAQWVALQASNRQRRHLRMGCCEAEVVLKKSRRGIQFFAHKQANGCRTGPETEFHRYLKQVAVEVARSEGWSAQTEVAGTSPDGEPWIADVLASKGRVQVAIEIQWSLQADDETLRRQHRYAKSGVRCLWLFRQARFPISLDVPAVRISGDALMGFSANLAVESGVQSMPVQNLLAAAFTRKLKFGLPIGTEAQVSVRVGEATCWRCHRHIDIVTGIDLRAGPHAFEFTVPDLTGHAGLHGALARRVGTLRAFSAVKIRPSKEQQRRYLSNGCSYCNALFGQFHEHEALLAQRPAREFAMQVDKSWLRLIRDNDYGVAGWGVF